MLRTPIVILVVIVALSTATLAAPQPSCVNPPVPSNLILAAVTRVVDGDTIDIRFLNGPRERVRLLGIDTPELYESDKLERNVRESGRSKEEIQKLGQLASEFSKSHLDRQDIGLEMDAQLRDNFGRLLAFIWLSHTNVLFNMLIVREGFAQVATIPPNVKYVDLLLACQREARDGVRGLWGR